ncbi:hypothetical protein [Georgenia sp. SYP-B2076]|uniref:hypothetical protein n=1 Tax=Georgenia sp. SYP-B2076 TaxID=2495881 RepID=UPI000F8E7E60|nr:hypothetical protein [Georgenia sp. SYP-B2076]
MDVDRQLAWDEGLQRIVNARAVPGRFTAARTPIPVTARLVWENAGEQLVRTVATGWTRRVVLVIVDDRRSHVRGVWVPAADVSRR